MTQSKHPITGTTHTLPFDRLSPRDFERLCLWLVEREGYERAEHLGATGSEQGRDVVAWREGALWAFQCKRVQRFGPRDALAEIEKVLALPEAERPVGLVFLVTCDVSANTRQQVRERCAGEMECHFWVGTELDERVKRHPDIVEEFFNRPLPQEAQSTTSLINEVERIQKKVDHNLRLNLDDTIQPVRKMPVTAFRAVVSGGRALDVSKELSEAVDDYLDYADHINSLVDSYNASKSTGNGTRPLQMGVPGSSHSSYIIQHIQQVSKQTLPAILERLKTCLQEGK